MVLEADPVLLLYRRLIDTAVAEAMKTVYGVATHGAVFARWWIEEYRPAKTDDDLWPFSFECCCHWLSIDAEEERKRLRGLVQARLRRAACEFAQSVAYVRRGEVVACMGMTAAIGKQYVLGMVSTVEEYELIVGIDRPEKQPRLFDGLDRKPKRAA